MKSASQTALCTPIFVAVLFTTAKIQNQPKCSLVNKWIKKMCDIHTMKYYFAIKKIMRFYGF